MLKLLIYLSIFLSFNGFLNQSYAYTKSKYFAKIENSETYIYSLPNDKNENKLFEIPKTYFVELLSQYNEYFYKAKYLDLTGYVKINEVSPVTNTPSNPYANNITFRVYSNDGLNIRSEPHTKNGLETIKGSLNVLDENIMYYGKISGEEVIKNRGTTWYYCKYKNDREVVLGYVYAGFCDMLSPIKENNENFTVCNNPFTTNNTEINSTTNNKDVKSLILIFTITPTLFLILLLFKPFKIIEKESKKQTKSILKRKRKTNRTLYDDFEL